MKEVPLCTRASLDQVRAEPPTQGRKPHVVPCLLRLIGSHQPRRARQQLLQVCLPPTVPADGDQPSKAARPVRPVQLLAPLEHLAVQRLDVAGEPGRQVPHHLPQALVAAARVLPLGTLEIVGIQQLQLLQGQFQPQGDAGRRLPVATLALEQLPEHVRVQLTVITPAHGHGDFSRFVLIEWRERKQAHAVAVPQRLRLAARDRGGNQPCAVGPPLGQPRQVP